MMQIGRFFSLQQGQVGQYLSPRVLMVRTPFRSPAAGAGATETCYVGFERLSLAQRFAQRLALLDCRFQMGLGQQLPYAYEVKVFNPGPLARTIARWERQTRSAGVNTNRAMGDRASPPLWTSSCRSVNSQLNAG